MSERMTSEELLKRCDDAERYAKFNDGEVFNCALDLARALRPLITKKHALLAHLRASQTPPHAVTPEDARLFLIQIQTMHIDTQVSNLLDFIRPLENDLKAARDLYGMCIESRAKSEALLAEKPTPTPTPAEPLPTRHGD